MWKFLILGALVARAAGQGGGKGGGEAAAPNCVKAKPDPTGYTTTLACPSPTSFSFYFTGAPATFVVPSDCGLPQAEGAEPPAEPPTECFFRVDACGGQGASWGGHGGFISSTISAAPGSSLFVYVGGIGNTFNGGGSGAGTSAVPINGGGATDVRTENGGPTGAQNLASRLVVAGGGGAGSNCRPICRGGAGGGWVGGKGKYVNTNPRVMPNGRGGTQAAGGECSSGFAPSAVAAATGALGLGGANVGGGAGGGGWYGGGAGWGAGGGGSSGSAPETTSVSAITQGDARCKGNGALFLTPLEISALPAGGLTAPPPPTTEPSPVPTHWPSRAPRPTKPRPTKPRPTA